MKPLSKYLKKIGFFTGLISIFFPLGAIQAQEAEDGSESMRLEEVVVTARRRSENLQDVPASVQAFSAEMLDAFRITDLADLTSRMPGVTYNPASLTDPQIFMRGIGNSINSGGADAAVGFFINGAYMSRNAGTIIDLYDLQQVEVIKGAQSLRFGKSVSGGVINYITKRPTEEFEGTVEATFGDYNQIDVAGSARGPISDTVGFSVSAVSRGHDEYGINTLGGGEEDEDRATIRGELLFDVSEQLDITLSGDVSRVRGGGKWYDVAIAGDSRAVRYNRFFNTPIPGLPEDFTLPDRNKPFDVGTERSGPRNLNGEVAADMWGLNLRIDYETASGMEFMSMTDYRDNKTQAFEDRCGMYWDFPLQQVRGGLFIPDISRIFEESVYTYLDEVPDCWLNTDKIDEVDQWSQEFRLSQSGDTLDWSVGFYYLSEKINREEHTGFLFPDFSMIGDYANAPEDGPPTGAGMTQGVSTAISQNDAENIGVFGEVTWHLNDTMDINAGLRYAKDKKDFTVTRFGDSFDAPIEGGGFVSNENASWDAWLPSLTFSWANTDDVNTYLSYARGYKPGGFDGEGSGDPDSAVFAFEPEYSDNFEAGVNSMLADNRVRLNVSAFYSKFKDLQTSQFVQVDPTRPPDFVTANAGKTTSYGLEANLEAQATDKLFFLFNYAYTNCEFKGELVIDNSGTDIDGNKCRRTPKHAFNVGANWVQPLSNNLEMFIGANYRWADDYFFDNLNRDVYVIDSQYSLDLRAGVNSADGRWNLMAWAKNATDETNAFNAFELFGTLYYKYGPPRTYGVTFRYNFF